MSRHDTTTTESGTWLSRIRAGRILIAAIMSEAGVIATLFLAIAVYARMTPSITGTESAELGERIGYYVAPAAGALTAFLSVLWAARALQSQFVVHGVLIGLVSALITAGFMAGARPEYRFMYLVAAVLRLIGGALGGVFAQRRYASLARRPATMTTALQEHTR